jgi:NAD(P)-dependent dehydrogenase (short-subunit alcohol dehydrogenase family)
VESESKVALVTGGGQGIGKCIAAQLLAEGMAVVLAEKDRVAGEEAAAELGAQGRVVFQETDVADEAAVRRAVTATLERFGRLDALINNAALAYPFGCPVDALPLDEWNRVLGSNLTGTFLCCKLAVPALRATGGAIVNIASTRALQSEANSEAYAASKGGIVALTHALAVSLGPAIRVNCISPGWIAVEDWKRSDRRHPPQLRPLDDAQHPVGRVGRPEDIAELTAFLLSERSGFITGQNFVVDGGMTRKMIYAE